MRSSRAVCALACLFALALLATGCGGDSSTSETGSGSGEVESRPAPPKGEFPRADGKTLREVINSAPDGPSPLVVSPAGLVYYTGENRFAFGVFELDRSPVSDAEVALYFSRVPKKTDAQSKSGNKGAIAKAQAEALEMPAVGPFPAAIESIETQPAFRALTTSDDANAAHVAYTAEIDFPSDGEWRIGAIVKHDGKTTGTLLPSAMVGEFTGIPRPGEKAPMISTPTAEDAGGDLSKITTRVPPDTQNKVDYADVYGKEPIVLLFATPQFCESRVCGPVVDVAEQVKETYGDDAAFIHMEIWEENDPGTKKTRPQVRAFNLPTEPWLFTIDRDGTVVESIQGPFGVEKLTEAVQKVLSA
ncbi:MAG TPA: hypothetical protein VK889_04745 [Solirubrobacterales bacterium]|nr:hypothetical protein [Solirubrobacterales bacterium]